MFAVTTKRLASIAAVALAACASAAGEPKADGAGAVTLPLTIERVWFKPSKKLISSGGDLTISHEGLELVTQKKTVHIPLDEVYMLSYGRFKSDVNTEWTILGLGESGPAELLAIRDGKKLGYGQRTRGIYESLRSACRQLGIAQYDVPQGFVAYDTFASQFTIAIPEAWDPHVESLVVQESGHSWGTVIFSSEEIDYPSYAEDNSLRFQDDPNLQRVLSGDVPAFFVARREIKSGMDCHGFTDKAKRKLIEAESKRTVDVLGYPLIQPFDIQPATVGLCAGLRARTHSRRPDGQQIQIDLFIVADRHTLYIAGLRTLDEHYEAARGPFEKAVSTIKFSVAR